MSLITFSTIVGSAIFIAASIVPRAAPDPIVVLMLWVIGGLVTLAGVFTYAELGTMFPEAGGAYQFLKESYGPLWGFLFGWTSFLVIQTGSIAYLAVAAADGAGELWPALGVFGGKFGGALLIAVVTLVNYFGLQAGAGLQNAIAAVKILAMVALIVFGLAATPETRGTRNANSPRLPRFLRCCRAWETSAGFGAAAEPLITSEDSPPSPIRHCSLPPQARNRQFWNAPASSS